MKKLSIVSENCLLEKNSYGVKFDGEEIDKLIQKNLPSDLQNYRDYPVKVEINIEFLGSEGLQINTNGYEVAEEESEVEE
ncbi:MAG: hypothetical protein ABF633_03020 [Clostridium sp.]|uniref:hypothetical protein n=1 Tax=Clostridium sp. TaxID=1506 RepID=UPI0039ECB808